MDGQQQFEDYIIEHTPILDFEGGMGYYGMFFIYQLLCKIKPEIVVESGVWKGGTTWLFDKFPGVEKLICFDPLADKPDEWFLYKSTRADYHTDNIFDVKLTHIIGKNVLVLFDDHQDHIPRLRYCQQNGLKHIILDDNYCSNVCVNETLAWVEHTGGDCSGVEIEERLYLNDIYHDSKLFGCDKPVNNNITYIKLK